MLSSSFCVVEMYHYELIMERFEGAFGADDKVLELETLRVKKYNRSTLVDIGFVLTSALLSFHFF